MKPTYINEKDLTSFKNWTTKKALLKVIYNLEMLPVKDAVFNNNNAEPTVVVKYKDIEKLASRYRKIVEKIELFPRRQVKL